MDNEPNAERKARRHAVLMRGVVTPILGLLAVTAIGLGVMNATAWKPSRTITAQAQIASSRYVVTDPGVAGLVDSDVKVKVRSGGSGNICVASTTAKDAAGWLSGERYVRLTGLDNWQTLGTQRAGSSTARTADASKGNESEGVEFKDSDMWDAVTCNAKGVEFESVVKHDSTVLLVDLGEKQNADVSFTWTRKTLPDFATPFYFVGGLLAVGAVLTASVFAMPPHRRRHRMVMGAAGRLEGHAEQHEEPAEEVSVREALTGSMSSLVSAFKPSRRGGRRHAASAGEATEQPTVVDPSARNLVADAAEASGYDDDMSAGEETSVISPDELQAYFARLAQESGGSFGGVADAGASADGASDGADSATETVDDSTGTESGFAEPSESAEPSEADRAVDNGPDSESEDETEDGTGDDDHDAEESVEEESR